MTPEKYKEENGREIPPCTIVWFIWPGNPHWDYMEYHIARQFKNVIMLIADSKGKPDEDYENRDYLT